MALETNSPENIVLKASMDARRPFMLVGGPGIGKTERIRQWCIDNNYQLITIIGSQLDPTDIIGLPAKAEMGKNPDGSPIYGTVHIPSEWQVRTMLNPRSMLFVDEWSNTPPSVQAATLNLLQNREWPDGTKLPDETIVGGAMNPTSQAADGFDLSLPTTNRLVFIDCHADPAVWKRGMREAWGRAHEKTKKEMLWRNRVAAFIDDNAGSLEILPNDTNTTEVYGINPNDESAMEVLRYAWASPRSWDVFTEVAAFLPDKNTAAEDKAMRGIIGAKAAQHFREWLLTHDKVSPRDALDNPDLVEWTTMNHSDLVILLRNVMAVPKGATGPEDFDKLLTIFEKLIEADRISTAAPFIKDVFAIPRKNGFTQLPQSKARMSELVTRYSTVMNDASKNVSSNLPRIQKS